MSYESVIALQLVLIAALAIRAVFCHSMISQLKSAIFNDSRIYRELDDNRHRATESLNNEINALRAKASFLEKEVQELKSLKQPIMPLRVCDDDALAPEEDKPNA